jgi:hypothetical protein
VTPPSLDHGLRARRRRHRACARAGRATDHGLPSGFFGKTVYGDVVVRRTSRPPLASRSSLIISTPTWSHPAGSLDAKASPTCTDVAGSVAFVGVLDHSIDDRDEALTGIRSWSRTGGEPFVGPDHVPHRPPDAATAPLAPRRAGDVPPAAAAKKSTLHAVTTVTVPPMALPEPRLPQILGPVPPGGAILDLGCHDGTLLARLRTARPDLELAGMDLDRAAGRARPARRARRRPARRLDRRAAVRGRHLRPDHAHGRRRGLARAGPSAHVR